MIVGCEKIEEGATDSGVHIFDSAQAFKECGTYLVTVKLENPKIHDALFEGTLLEKLNQKLLELRIDGGDHSRDQSCKFIGRLEVHDKQGTSTIRLSIGKKDSNYMEFQITDRSGLSDSVIRLYDSNGELRPLFGIKDD